MKHPSVSVFTACDRRAEDGRGRIRVGRGRKLHGDQRTAAGQTLHAGVAHLPQVPRPGGIRTHVPGMKYVHMFQV